MKPDGADSTQYYRRDTSEGVRPLLIFREFEGAFENYFEVDEEFRLYHNLAFDPKQSSLNTFDDSGHAIEVVRLSKDAIHVRLEHLRQFQAGLGLYFALYVDSNRYSPLEIKDVDGVELSIESQTAGQAWSRTIRKCDWIKGYRSHSRLLGKVLIPPPPRENAGIWPFSSLEKDPPVTFAIGVDNLGRQIEADCDPDKLNDRFDGLPGAPQYLTPVVFRREVLSKYYAEPQRYSVEDGLIRCLSIWLLRIDNDHENHVVVYLGDLGRDLPYNERLHWKSHNVAPDVAPSSTNIERSMMAIPSNARAADLAFRSTYSRVNSKWLERWGWPLFLPPIGEDSHLLGTVRVPLSDSQAEFDDQILTLTKLLVDSLNESQLKKLLNKACSDAKGIQKLEKWLEQERVSNRVEIVSFLKSLQSLRSRGAAHKKGKDYARALGAISEDTSELKDIVRDLLARAIRMLEQLAAIQPGKSEP